MEVKGKKVLVTGANGTIGSRFNELLQEMGCDVTAVDREQCDICDKASLKAMIKEVQPDILINCAAYLDFDKGESEQDKVYAINTEALWNILEVCKEDDIFLVQFSSDYVFDGKQNEPYTEEDQPNPISVYGMSKFRSEKIVESYEKGLVFRLSWILGSTPHCFLLKVLDWVNNNSEVRIAFDDVSCPTYVDDVVRYTVMAIEKDLTGLYHLVSSGYTSRYELAQYFALTVELDKLIQPAKMKDFNLPGNRPYFSAMSNAKLQKDLGIEIPSWQNNVNRWIEEVYNVKYNKESVAANDGRQK